MNTWSRRQLLQSAWQGALGTAGLLLLGGCGWRETLFGSGGIREIPVELLGPSSAAGHRLRDGFNFPEPNETRKTGVLIVGGGIAGLSAGWRLQKRGFHDFRLLELENDVGGNSRHGKNAVSAYPRGAHYVTLLNEEATVARELFEELGIITGQRDGLPVYNEYFLCQAPQERLFQLRRWQPGLLPRVGLLPSERAEFDAFFAQMDRFRELRGRDGRPAFTIPLEQSSRDPELTRLDQLTMADYLNRQGWRSPSLHWFVNYSCRDDFGTPHGQTSAWAGIHYFCSRRGRAWGVQGSAVLTWPEGNGFLVEQLKSRLAPRISGQQLVIRVRETPTHVEVDAWNEAEKRVTRHEARAVILSVPRFIANRLLDDPATSARVPGPATAPAPVYSPWLVANLTLDRAPTATAGDAPLSWDNVFYDSPSLGYVVATHQNPTIHTGATVWTYYRPLDHLEPAAARREAYARSATQWRELVLDDLARAHPDLRFHARSLEVWVWGHAMVRPGPGFIWGADRARMLRPQGRVHFAHSDQSGISIFEEANYRGVHAADEVLKNVRG